jgi:hypothetical protein
MKQVVEIQGVFALVVDDKVSYLAPGHVYSWPEEEAPFFKRRLQSTRGRRNAWWTANEAARPLMNDAPFCPVVRGRLRRFLWGGPYDTVLFPDQDDTPSIRQGGSLQLNYYASFWGGVSDPVRFYLAGLDLPEVPFAEQGHLRVYAIDEPPEEIRRQIRCHNPFQPQRVFNHFVCNSNHRVIRRVVDGISISLLMVDGEGEGEVMVLSEDHQDSLVTLDEGWYALVHPVPKPQRPVD